jgi:hypothetical protein
MKAPLLSGRVTSCAGEPAAQRLSAKIGSSSARPHWVSS